MDGADWLVDPNPGALASAARFWAPLLIAWVGLVHYRRAHRARRGYLHLSPADREMTMKALLFVIQNGAIEKGQNAPGYTRKPALVLAELLHLHRHLVDEALRRLIEHGYLEGLRGRSAWRLTTHIDMTPRGRSFCERTFGNTGGVCDLGPWGLVILSVPASEPASVAGLILLPQERPGMRPPTP